MESDIVIDGKPYEGEPLYAGCADPGDAVDYCSVCVRRPAARASTVCEDCARGDIA